MKNISTTSYLAQEFISIIIPVFNDSARLKLCLQALENQTYSKDLYEVIVVDNASQEDIKSVVSQFSQAKFAYEATPSSYAARNKGISLAKGEILAFTDADCIPESDWIEKGVTSLTNTPNCGLVGGRIDIFFRNPEQPTPVELYDSIALKFTQESDVKNQHFSATANLFTFKHVIDTVGGFDATLKSGGDREWGERVFQAGYKQVYADDACIKHPARYSFSQLYTRVARFVGGKHDLFMRQNPSLWEIVEDFVGILKPPFRSFYRIFKNPQLHGTKQKLKYTLAMFFLRYVVISEKCRLYLGGTSRRE
ncbi:glycosyltransferase [Calothrix sp. FACHB-1219]|uniref:glycosyltransferase n=1 Tax=unclassified Calothrix TaxID=2619626 RepID=UPI001685F503|nr:MULTISPECIES: glycosyltransferase [unclassified Calothrix]MBD2205069.1 glycosyltransferase [Calothrix sp. FACHB-168]MBD2219867.1 glycosyltransferase [Calothrix sp. FACHB-1219]